MDFYNHPLDLSIAIFLILSLITFIISTITNNVSQVDKLWSIIPIIYSWIFALYSKFDMKLSAMAILVTIWGCRLTYNAYRRGFYCGGLKFWQGDEDYRWEYIRKNVISNPFLWLLFNIFFISLA